MRIIRGKYKGRRFFPPNNLPTRPTTDYAKEGLFNILENHFSFETINFLDLFCGTGNISYEFVSRGCEDVTSVDLSPKCVKFINEMNSKLGIIELRVIQNNVLKFISDCGEKFDIIFAGPPYAFEDIELLPEMVVENKLLKAKGWFILEHSPKHSFEDHPIFKHQRNYGKTIFSIFIAN